jgi:hypothetical protein
VRERHRLREPLKTFYFVGGPAPGRELPFFHELDAVGGPPHGWRIYPHADGRGRALHIVEAESDGPILAHLAHFGSNYERGPIIEVVMSPGKAAEPGEVT